MKSISTLFITIVLSFLSFALSAQENPFMKMANQKYADYAQELHNMGLKLDFTDTVQIQKIILQLEEVAQKTGSAEWKLRVDRIKIDILGSMQSLYGEERVSSEKMLKTMLEALEKAKKANSPRMELDFRHLIINYYWNHFKNYELAFEQCVIQDEQLQKFPTEELPGKAIYYVPIADAYYFFKDYSRAIFYFAQILKEKDHALNQSAKQSARNGMGLSYRYGYNDLDRSDSCFYAIIQITNLRPEKERDDWEGIAEGNIGYNMLLREEYNKAIPLLKSSIEKMVKFGDYAYASGPAINLADIYLKLGNISEAKRYIDLARDYYQKLPRTGRLKRIYEVMGKYYAATGNIKLSIAYMDSTVAEHKKDEEQFTALQLMRVEQRKHLSEQKEQEKQLFIEKQKSDYYLRIGITIFTMLLFVCIILFYTIILYRKKKAAHQELVRKSQEWAQVISEPDEADVLIMKELELVMNEQKIYRDTSLTLDSLAQRIGAKRHYVSKAINCCTQKNFNTFINEYRIKEAIRLLSEKNLQKFSIDSLAFDTGFNDCKNFYRVFKKMTGLSPKEFMNNLGDK